MAEAFNTWELLSSWHLPCVFRSHPHRRVITIAIANSCAFECPAAGSKLVSASRDCTARVWNLATGMAESILKGHDDYISAAAWSPDDSLIATASGDHTVRLWAQRGNGARNGAAATAEAAITDE